MNKIIEALLQAKFPTVATNLLMEVVSATPNVEVATEILCGLYVEPTINPQPKEGFAKSKANFVVQHYDKFTGNVHYSYNPVPTEEFWVKKGEEAPKYGDKEALQVKSGCYYTEDLAKKLGISIDEAKTYSRVTVYGTPSNDVRSDYTSITNWQ